MLEELLEKMFGRVGMGIQISQRHLKSHLPGLAGRSWSILSLSLSLSRHTDIIPAFFVPRTDKRSYHPLLEHTRRPDDDRGVVEAKMREERKEAGGWDEMMD